MTTKDATPEGVASSEGLGLGPERNHVAWGLALLAQTLEFSEEVRMQCQRGHDEIERMRLDLKNFVNADIEWHDALDAGACPVERPVRPAVWWREQRDAFEGPQTLEPMYLLGPEKPGSYASGATYEPLYDQASIDAAVAAERERCSKICDEKARVLTEICNALEDDYLCKVYVYAAQVAMDCARSARSGEVVLRPNVGVERTTTAPPTDE